MVINLIHNQIFAYKYEYNFELGKHLYGFLCILKVSTACMGAPCAFGCNSVGSSGFSCGCPSGYQHIGQGHCISTIGPGSGGYGPDIGNVPVYPLTEGQRPINDKLITTEGCFSCKVRIKVLSKILDYLRNNTNLCWCRSD